MHNMTCKGLFKNGTGKAIKAPSSDAMLINLKPLPISYCPMTVLRTAPLIGEVMQVIETAH